MASMPSDPTGSKAGVLKGAAQAAGQKNDVRLSHWPLDCPHKHLDFPPRPWTAHLSAQTSQANACIAQVSIQISHTSPLMPSQHHNFPDQPPGRKGKCNVTLSMQGL